MGAARRGGGVWVGDGVGLGEGDVVDAWVRFVVGDGVGLVVGDEGVGLSAWTTVLVSGSG